MNIKAKNAETQLSTAWIVRDLSPVSFLRFHNKMPQAVRLVDIKSSNMVEMSFIDSDERD